MVLPCGARFTPAGEKKGADGYTWYKISVYGTTGYIRSDLAEIKTIVLDTASDVNASGMSDSEFEAYLKNQGFPADYITSLMAIHHVHPSWVFKAQKTGLNWNDVIAVESKPGKSVVAASLPKYYRSKAAGCYNSKTGKYISYDSGGWFTATPEVIKFYMDPRNFLNEYDIFQFMTHSFDSSTQSVSHMKEMVKGTFLDGAYPTVSGETTSFATYSDAIFAAGKEKGVNPYVLASMILVEQGSKGTGGCISGNVKGYKGYFNFFNIGAYKTKSMTAVTRGLWYASRSGSYGRPWNTRYKSILGGAEFYFDEYVAPQQNTLYLKKFNVNNGLARVGTHQYMSNVQGAYLEAYRLWKAYTGYETSITFVIPVFNNMPSKACPLPTK